MLAALATGCQDGAGATEPEAPAGPPPVNVAVTSVAPSALSEQIELSGRLDPWVEVRVASELGGLVEQVGFTKGALVEEGQVLARVGTDLHQAALEEAEAVLAGAQATYDRVRQLVDRQAVPRHTLDEFAGLAARLPSGQAAAARTPIPTDGAEPAGLAP